MHDKGHKVWQKKQQLALQHKTYSYYNQLFYGPKKQNESSCLVDRIQRQGGCYKLRKLTPSCEPRSFFAVPSCIQTPNKTQQAHRWGGEGLNCARGGTGLQKTFKGDWWQIRFHQRVPSLFSHSGMLLDVWATVGVNYRTECKPISGFFKVNKLWWKLIKCDLVCLQHVNLNDIESKLLLQDYK